MEDNTYDVIIIGAGMAGMSAAEQLIGRADRVLICEQETPAHRGSSSYGDTRMYREMYSDPWLCRVARKTGKLWAELEGRAKKALRSPHGLLFYGEDWGEETIEGSIQGAKKVMLDQQIDFTEYDAAAIEKRFPLKCKPEWVGLFEPNAGAVLVEEVFAVWTRAIDRAGFTLRTHTPVAEVIDRGTDVEVRLQNGERAFAQRAILAAGPWTRHFLPEALQPVSYSVWQMLWAYYTVEEDFADRFPQWFNFQHREPSDPNQGLFYGFPSLARTETGAPYVKVGIDWTAPELKYDRMSPGTSYDPPAELLDIMDEFVRNYTVGIKERFYAQLSPYTMSADVQFCLDKVSDNVVAFSHGSGQSFKFAPMIGRCLADLATDRPAPIDLTPWRFERLVA